MEIEAKFRIDDRDVFDWLRGKDVLGSFRLQAHGHQEQYNTYYDTADGRLQQARYGLRIRTVGDHHRVTLKGEGTYHDGLFERGEWEVDADQPDPTTWPESEARTRTIALIGDEPLLPLLTTRTNRHRILVYAETRLIIELCLDEGMIEAAGMREAFRELEVEVCGEGTRADLDACVEALRQNLTLVPENRTKFARGLALLQRS